MDFHPIRISLNDLISALEEHTGAEHFLDLEMGDVLRIPMEALSEEEYEEQAGPISENPDRFLQIGPVSSSKGLEVMEDFVESLPPSKEKTMLDKALGQRKPFRSFKDALSFLPSLREEWFRFHDEAFRRLVVAWLEGEGIRGRIEGRFFLVSSI